MPVSRQDKLVTVQSLRQQVCLVLITFYFLLRVGEYTKTRMVICNGASIQATQIVKFTVSNVRFFKNGKIIAQDLALQILLAFNVATSKINNQKNGCMGDTIYHQAINKDYCPIKVLALHVNDILTHG
jgi:hypothetical protein